MLLAFVSAPLEFTVGESFVSSFTNTYRAAVPLLFAVLLPTSAILFFRIERKQHELAHRYPTWLVRWVLVFPLTVALWTAMLVFSPFGWSALAGWAVGTPSAQKTAKVLSVAPMLEQRRIGNCDQKVEISVDGIEANICIEDRVVGLTPKAGDSILVTGRSSLFGFYIEEIRVK
jgi:hypothetical protein